MPHIVRIYLKCVLLLLVIFGSGLILAGTLYAGPGQTALLSDLDIPLMRGFHEDKASRLLFDTPEGRIVEVRASGPERAARVFDYYRLVLPTLSWRSVGNKTQPAWSKGCDGPLVSCLRAHRDGEILTIRIRETKDSTKGKVAGTIIYFSVNPE